MNTCPRAPAKAAHGNLSPTQPFLGEKLDYTWTFQNQSSNCSITSLKDVSELSETYSPTLIIASPFLNCLQMHFTLDTFHFSVRNSPSVWRERRNDKANGPSDTSWGFHQEQNPKEQKAWLQHSVISLTILCPPGWPYSLLHSSILEIHSEECLKSLFWL